MRKSVYLIMLLLIISPIMVAEDCTFLEYHLSEISSRSYEEGRVYGAIVFMDTTTQSFVFYYNGAMIGIPIYHRQIKEIEEVAHSNTSTGELYYGKSTEGTFFVEKEFYQYMNGLPQGLIMFGIPETYYKDILQQIASLPSLPNELMQ